MQPVKGMEELAPELDEDAVEELLSSELEEDASEELLSSKELLMFELDDCVMT